LTGKRCRPLDATETGAIAARATATATATATRATGNGEGFGRGAWRQTADLARKRRRSVTASRLTQPRRRCRPRGHARLGAE
jgi:hypothetical protein